MKNDQNNRSARKAFFAALATTSLFGMSAAGVNAAETEQEPQAKTEQAGQSPKVRHVLHPSVIKGLNTEEKGELKEVVTRGYNEDMENESYEAAIEKAKALVHIIVSTEGFENSKALKREFAFANVKLADAMTMVRDYKSARTSYDHAKNTIMQEVGYEEESEHRALTLLPGMAGVATSPDMIQIELSIQRMEMAILKEILAKESLEEEVDALMAKDADIERAEAFELVRRRNELRAAQAYQNIDSTLARATAAIETSEGMYTPLMFSVYEAKKDLKMLQINQMLSTAGVNAETQMTLVGEIGDADFYEERVFEIQLRKLKEKHGSAEHPEALDAYNERIAWFSKTARAAKAQENALKTVEILETYRDDKIAELIEAEAEKLIAKNPGMDRETALEQASSTPEIDAIRQEYRDTIIAQLEIVANEALYGSNAIGELQLAEEATRMESEDKMSIGTVSSDISNDMSMGTKAHYAMGVRSERNAMRREAVEAKQKILAEVRQDPDATPENIARAEIAVGDMLLTMDKSASKADDHYKEAWRLLSESGKTRELAEAFGSPSVLNFKEPAYVMDRDRNSTRGGLGTYRNTNEPLVPAGYNYWMSCSFEVNERGHIRDFEVLDTNAPTRVTDTLEYIFEQETRARPKRNLETGEAISQRVKSSFELGQKRQASTGKKPESEASSETEASTLVAGNKPSP